MKFLDALAGIVAESSPGGFFDARGGVGLEKAEAVASDGADKNGVLVSFVTCSLNNAQIMFHTTDFLSSCYRIFTIKLSRPIFIRCVNSIGR
jgi:hypothetical protein